MRRIRFIRALRSVWLMRNAVKIVSAICSTSYGLTSNASGFELLGSAGELAQDERAILVGAARAIFLGYQIHSVLERRDERDVARAIMREKIVAIEARK